MNKSTKNAIRDYKYESCPLEGRGKSCSLELGLRDRGGREAEPGGVQTLMAWLENTGTERDRPAVKSLPSPV